MVCGILLFTWSVWGLAQDVLLDLAAGAHPGTASGAAFRAEWSRYGYRYRLR